MRVSPRKSCQDDERCRICVQMSVLVSCSAVGWWWCVVVVGVEEEEVYCVSLCKERGGAGGVRGGGGGAVVVVVVVVELVAALLPAPRPVPRPVPRVFLLTRAMPPPSVDETTSRRPSRGFPSGSTTPTFIIGTAFVITVLAGLTVLVLVSVLELLVVVLVVAMLALLLLLLLLLLVAVEMEVAVEVLGAVVGRAWTGPQATSRNSQANAKTTWTCREQRR